MRHRFEHEALDDTRLTRQMSHEFVASHAAVSRRQFHEDRLHSHLHFRLQHSRCVDSFSGAPTHELNVNERGDVVVTRVRHDRADLVERRAQKCVDALDVGA